MNLMEQIMAEQRKQKARGTDTTINGCGCAAMPPEIQEQAKAQTVRRTAGKGKQRR